ncbi:MAG: tetratricopeptide repeat protein [Ferruginibacter sp.]
MAETKVKTETPEKDAIEIAKGFWARFSKPIIIAGSAIIVLVGGYLGYKYLYKLPNEQKASEMIFPAERLFDKMANEKGFSKDSVNIVLNGGSLEGNAVTGLLKIISNYGGTAAGNRAHYMAGACYLQIKEFDKAIKQLKEFDANGASQVESRADIMLGHAYSELKKTDEALSYYKKAARAASDDAGLSSEALYMAARYAEASGKTKEAVELFQQLKNEYATTPHVQGGDVDKYLGKLGALK